MFYGMSPVMNYSTIKNITPDHDKDDTTWIRKEIVFKKQLRVVKHSAIRNIFQNMIRIHQEKGGTQQWRNLFPDLHENISWFVRIKCTQGWDPSTALQESSACWLPINQGIYIHRDRIERVIYGRHYIYSIVHTISAKVSFLHRRC